MNSLDGCNCQIRPSAECSKPRALSFLELAKDATLEIDQGRYPLILIFGTVVGGGKYRNLCFLNFFTMSVFHFVVPSHKHPTSLVTKSDDLGVFHVPPDVSVLISEPLGKPLNSKSCRSQAHGYRFG